MKTAHKLFIVTIAVAIVAAFCVMLTACDQQGKEKPTGDYIELIEEGADCLVVINKVTTSYTWLAKSAKLYGNGLVIVETYANGTYATSLDNIVLIYGDLSSYGR